MKTWTIFWLTGNREQVHGATISEAFTRQGYSAGALGAVDFYCEGLGDDWPVLVNAEGKHDWFSDQTLEQFPEHYTRVDAPPPQMTSSKWVADRYYAEIIKK